MQIVYSIEGATLTAEVRLNKQAGDPVGVFQSLYPFHPLKCKGERYSSCQ